MKEKEVKTFLLLDLVMHAPLKMSFIDVIKSYKLEVFSEMLAAVGTDSSSANLLIPELIFC